MFYIHYKELKTALRLHKSSHPCPSSHGCTAW